MVNVLTIVWRKSLEAMLVIGIPAAWVSGRGGGGGARSALEGGVLAGLALAAVVQGALGMLSDQGQEVFQALLLLFVAGMLVLGTDRLMGLEQIPPGPDPLWNTSAWLDDGGGVGPRRAA